MPKVALGVLMPPSFSLTGGLATSIRLAVKMFMADICWPMPVEPSKVPFKVHLVGQSVPESPPMQEAAAAYADASR